MRKLLLFLLLSSCCWAQTWLDVTATHIYGGGNALLPAGNITFTATDSQGNPISFQPGGGGQMVTFPVTCPITAGAISGPQCLVANVSVSNPSNFCYSAVITDSLNHLVLGGAASGYTCVQPQTTNTWCSGGFCNFDAYVPNLPAAITALMPPPGLSSLGGIYATSCAGLIVNGYAVTGQPVCVPGYVAALPTVISAACTAAQTWALAGAGTGLGKVTLTGACALNLTGLAAGGSYTVTVTQGGGGTLSLGSGCAWKVSGGGGGAVTPSAGTNAVDELDFKYDGANCYAVYTKNFN